MTPWLAARGDEARVAVMFLTALPAGRVPHVVPIGRTAWAWPLVGALVGAVFAASHAAALALHLGPPVGAVLALAVTTLATGALHEDGLADLADGIGGGADPQRRLEIMRDSRLGSYGAMALILTFLLAAALWAETEPARVLPVAVAVAAISRMALPVWLAAFPGARADGLGRQAAQDLGGRGLVALGLGAAVAVLALPMGSAVLALLACLGVQLGLCRYAMARLGGITGDVLGAAQVLGGLAALLMVAG